ncbi:GNAT family N-acetyltransferase [Methylomonas albis]|uniref:GNAT family N-acetyltransferase n=1 Tax=Methylomonas albis TaxID=1854563 RepID=A0ABR9D532_9GAMM|nr:GNAT family N-acetyltransferase [Methylomonas albis]MBD9357368.1 GNAT family N-acetyltransferase [Methylomonas albis]
MGIWPSFLAGHHKGIDHSETIDAEFADLQLMALCRKDGNVVGVAHAVALPNTAIPDVLPAEGWDWAIERALLQPRQRERGETPCILSITVLPRFQRAGIASALLLEYLERARQNGAINVIAPVRPILGATLLNMPTEVFLELRRPDGYHIDPWIRTHEKLGGKIAGICANSMRILAPIKRWQKWGAQLNETGDRLLVEGQIAPIRVLPNSGFAEYIEPNIWMMYSLELVK